MKSVTEPARKSLLDIVRDNLRAAGRVTYITRAAYFGEYFDTHEDLEQKMKNIIDDLQKDYANVSITGLLLVYPQYYVHVLEAPEDIIYKHLKIIYDDKNNKPRFGKSAFLPFYHNVNQRFFVEWSYVYTVPPTLLEKLEAHSLSDIQKQMSSCFIKLYTLCDYISSTTRDHSIAMNDILRNMGEKVAEYLPESTVLEFLLNVKTSVLQSIEDYVNMHSTVPFINLYNDYIWPPPRDIILCGAFQKESHKRVGCRLIKEEETRDHSKHH